RGSTFSFTCKLELVAAATRRALIVDADRERCEEVVRWLSARGVEASVEPSCVAALDALWFGVASGQPFSLVVIAGADRDDDARALAEKIRVHEELSAMPLMLVNADDTRAAALDTLWLREQAKL
ncbi:MAG TPA: hypothetical protein VI299_22205, partial [Polyangiales bacterium]